MGGGNVVARVPSHPEPAAVTLRPRTAVVSLIAVATLFRLGWAAALPATTDEAYHWQYTLHPALSYFDHPPMTMLVAQAGIAACGGWVHPLSLRLGFVLLCAGTSWFLYRWTAGWFGDRAGVWAVLGFTLSHYLTAFGGPFALPDSPLFFFAVLTWWQASEAVLAPAARGKGGTRRWLLVGVGFGGALLSKYHAILLPAGVVAFAAVTPGARRLLRAPGPYLAVFVGSLLFSPVVYWNATHEWASFKFQGGRMGGGGSPLAHGGPLVWLVGPLLFLLPWMWFWLTLELGRRLVRFGTVVGIERLLVCLAAAPLAFFLVNAALTGKVLPHWPLVGFLPLFPLVGARWAALHRRYPRAVTAMAVSWIVGELAILAAILVQVNAGVIPVPAGFVDETRAFSGWESVVAELEARGALAEPDGFLVTNRWDDSAQLAFAVRNRIPVACYHSFDARGFALWSKPDDYLGRTGYLVLVDQPDEADVFRQFGDFFRSMTKFAEFPMTRGGVPFRPVRVYRCESQRLPYPFDYTIRTE